MNAWQQVALPLSYLGIPKGEQKERAKQALKLVGLEDKLDSLPNQLS
jgi:putative ABC transport system ATP-binding protein